METYNHMRVIEQSETGRNEEFVGIYSNLALLQQLLALTNERGE